MSNSVTQAQLFAQTAIDLIQLNDAETMKIYDMIFEKDRSQNTIKEILRKLYPLPKSYS
jgi:hypothetical protein